MERARAETPDIVLRSVEAYVRSRRLVLQSEALIESSLGLLNMRAYTATRLPKPADLASTSAPGDELE